MPQGGSGRILNEMCSSRICVDEYRDGEMKGRIYNNYYEEPMEFSNVMQMLKKMEAMFDGFEYPQRTLKPRSFQGGQQSLAAGQAVGNARLWPRVQEERGRAATFYVKVIFRKNASWQGNVCWVDGGKNENFRSVFELLTLMDGVMA